MLNLRLRTRLPLLLVVLAACSPGFDDPTQVNDFRILAVSVDPPEFTYPSDEIGIPQGIGGAMPWVTLRLLVADPEGEERELTWQARACILDDSQECDPKEPSADLGKGSGNQPGQLELAASVPMELVLAAFQADPAKGLFGAALWLAGTVSADQEELPFLKALLFSPDYAGKRAANRNPGIADLLVGPKDEESPPVLSSDFLWEVTAGSRHRLLPVIPAEDRQKYIVLTFEMEQKELTEEMTVRFMGSCGSFASSEKSEVLNPAFETEEDRANKSLAVEWSAPAEPTECTLWFIALDGRGGVGWFEWPVRVI